MIHTDVRCATQHTPITPDDVTPLVNDNDELIYRALFVQNGGDVVIEDRAGIEVTYAVDDKTILPFSPYRVKATGTTAGGIVGWR